MLGASSKEKALVGTLQHRQNCQTLVEKARDSTHDFNTQSGGALRLPFLDSERLSESIFGIQSAPRFQAIYGVESVPPLL